MISWKWHRSAYKFFTRHLDVVMSRVRRGWALRGCGIFRREVCKKSRKIKCSFILTDARLRLRTSEWFRRGPASSTLRRAYRRTPGASPCHGQLHPDEPGLRVLNSTLWYYWNWYSTKHVHWVALLLKCIVLKLIPWNSAGCSWWSCQRFKVESSWKFHWRIRGLVDLIRARHMGPRRLSIDRRRSLDCCSSSWPSPLGTVTGFFHLTSPLLPHCIFCSRVASVQVYLPWL